MNEITDLLKAWSDGNQEAFDKLIPLVDPELKKTAHAYLSGERPGHIWQTTALVNEALMKLFRENIVCENRGHFYGLVARRMRQVLVDCARKQASAKRGNWAQRVHIAEARYESLERSQELIMLDQALSKLASIDERKATIVEYCYFIGLSHKEIAQTLNVSTATVDRDWSFARTWLKREMAESSKQ